MKIPFEIPLMNSSKVSIMEKFFDKFPLFPSKKRLQKFDYIKFNNNYDDYLITGEKKIFLNQNLNKVK